MWRGAIDVFDFVPLTNASYSGGIIITEWFSAESDNINKRELKNILFAISAKGQTCVPVKLFWKGHLAKLEIALAKGKKNIDKKQTKKAADIQRDEERALKKFK